MNIKIKRNLSEIILFVCLILVDQLTKNMAVNSLKDRKAFSIIDNVLELYYLPNGNTGAAFGMLKGHQTLFVLIAILVVILIGYILYNMPADKKFRLISLLLVFIAAGGIGNLIDRLKQNYVVDFIYFKIIDFPVFNVADMYVSVSTVILAIYMIFIIKEEDYKILEEAVKAPFKKKKD